MPCCSRVLVLGHSALPCLITTRIKTTRNRKPRAIAKPCAIAPPRAVMTAVDTWHLIWQPWPQGPQPFAAPGLAQALGWLRTLPRQAGNRLSICATNHPALPAVIQACLNTGIHLRLIPPHLADKHEHLTVPGLDLNDASTIPPAIPTDSSAHAPGTLELFSSATTGTAKILALTAEQCWRGAARRLAWLGFHNGEAWHNFSTWKHVPDSSQLPNAPSFEGQVDEQLTARIPTTENHAPRAASEQVYCCCLGLDHLGGLSQVLRACLCGYQLILCRTFSPAIIAQLWPQLHGISMVPTMLHRLVRQHLITPGPIILLGGASCPDQLYQQLRQQGFDLRRCYAATECGGTVSGEDPLRPTIGNVATLTGCWCPYRQRWLRCRGCTADSATGGRLAITAGSNQTAHSASSAATMNKSSAVA